MHSLFLQVTFTWGHPVKVAGLQAVVVVVVGGWGVVYWGV